MCLKTFFLLQSSSERREQAESRSSASVCVPKRFSMYPVAASTTRERLREAREGERKGERLRGKRTLGLMALLQCRRRVVECSKSDTSFPAKPGFLTVRSKREQRAAPRSHDGLKSTFRPHRVFSHEKECSKSDVRWSTFSRAPGFLAARSDQCNGHDARR